MARKIKTFTGAEPWLARWDAGNLSQDVTGETADQSPVQFPIHGLNWAAGIRLTVAGSLGADGDDLRETLWQLLLVDHVNVDGDGDPQVVDVLEWVSEVTSRRMDADNDGGLFLHRGRDFLGFDLRRQTPKDRKLTTVLSIASSDQTTGNLYLIDWHAIRPDENV